MNEEAPTTGRRRIRLITALVLACAAVVVTGVTATRVSTADRTPPAAGWAFADAPAERAEHPTGLASLLVPYDDYDHAYGPGPDDHPFGHDTALSGKEYWQRLRTVDPTAFDAPREDLRRGFRARGVEAVASRSYARGGEGDIVIMSLARLSGGGARPLARLMTDALATKRGATLGPAPKGHRDARCYRLPPVGTTGEADRVNFLECVARIGDVVLLAQVFTAGPLDQYRLALIGGQLDRLTQQGQPA
ncbi:hypothetical protein [Streptomyces sp. NPDC005955]|uniref:hypothetical protein n=1 Tax=Streptomyces sp. NPDC005955 TaxID=3364738 RepID=UPI0036A63949